MGKKKKNKGLQNDPAAILKKAEKFFQKENYLLAKREFEKLEAVPGQNDLLKKIEICDQEIHKQKGKDFLKKARKIEKKGGNPHAAAKYFEEAHNLLGEKWIREKIERIRNTTLAMDVRQSAGDAEKAGDYLRAAELYDSVISAGESEEMLLRKAVCLARGEAYEDAVSTFRNLALEEPAHRYDFGFALAKTGRYAECLKTWDGIGSRDEGFHKQKSQVAALLVSALYSAFEKREDPEKLYKEGKYLMDAGYGSSELSLLVEQCLFHWIGEMWEKEDYEGVLELLQWVSPEMESALLQLYAKTLFKLAEKTGKCGEDFSMFWLSAIYSEDFESRFSDADLRDAARAILIDWAEDLLSGSDKPEADIAGKISAQWSLEKEVARVFHELGRNRKNVGFRFLTPRLAAQTGKSLELRELVRKNRSFFKSKEDYLRTGCCYSPAWESFYHLVAGEYEKAVQTLVVGEKGDEFTDYVKGRVLFALGLSRMVGGKRPPDAYENTMPTFFDMIPEYEDRFISVALDAEDVNVLQRFKEVLTGMYDSRHSHGLAKALSLVMSRLAIKMVYQRQINEKVFSLSLKKALEIDPENEHARGLLKDAQSNLDMMALEKALSRLKMNTACKIVMTSESDLVRNAFFDFFERNMQDMNNELTSDREKIYLLKDFHKWCARVDEDHDILYHIEERLEELEGENFA
ncbi:conserved hypothetical protein [delta proteobacterium NaphS2]|nr:conserved hypothetical protein [delta proteobacterium NaphS2]